MTDPSDPHVRSSRQTEVPHPQHHRRLFPRAVAGARRRLPYRQPKPHPRGGDCVAGELNPTTGLPPIAIRRGSMGPSPMAARAAGGCSTAALAFFRLHPLRRTVRPAAAFAGGCSSGLHGGCRSRLAHSIVDSVLDELRSRRRVRVSAK